MARMFRGESVHKVDTKGRVSIPAGFRRVLEDSDPRWTKDRNPDLVIVYGDHRQNYLECYTMAAMAEVDAVIGNTEKMQPGTWAGMAADFIGETEACQVDDIMSVTETAGHLIDGFGTRSRA